MLSEEEEAEEPKFDDEGSEDDGRLGDEDGNSDDYGGGCVRVDGLGMGVQMLGPALCYGIHGEVSAALRSGMGVYVLIQRSWYAHAHVLACACASYDARMHACVQRKAKGGALVRAASRRSTKRSAAAAGLTDGTRGGGGSNDGGSYAAPAGRSRRSTAGQLGRGGYADLEGEYEDGDDGGGVGGGGGGDALGYTLEPGIPVPEVPQALSAEEGKKALNRWGDSALGEWDLVRVRAPVLAGREVAVYEGSARRFSCWNSALPCWRCPRHCRLGPGIAEEEGPGPGQGIEHRGKRFKAKKEERSLHSPGPRLHANRWGAAPCLIRQPTSPLV
eukprot:1161859-Pelagomonas_calceolata.AAC.4